MKIKSLHIDNFGNLNKVDRTFTDGLNAQLGGNGYGKSTLTAFIRAMFYGLPNNSKNNTLRGHYAPFNQGGYGGSITFEHDGKEYTLRRAFGTTSSKDTFSLYQKTNPVKMASDEVGQFFFGLDEASFDRLLIIANNQLEFGTESVATKLGALAGGLEPGAVEEAGKVIAEAAKKIKTQKGHNGAFWDNGDRIAEIDGQITQIEQDDLQFTEVQKSYQKLVSERTALSDKISAMDSIESTRSRKEAYDGRLQEIKTKENDIALIKKKYPNGLAADEEINQIREELSQIQTLEKAIEEDAETIAHFADGFPVEEEIKKIADNIENFDQLNTGKVVISSAEKELYSRYERANLKPEDVQEAKQLKQDYLEASSEDGQAKAPSFVWPIVFGAFGIVLVILASILLPIQTIVGIVLYSFGGVSLLAAALLLGFAFKKKQEGAKTNLENEKRKAGIAGQISASLKRFGIQSEDPLAGLTTLETESGIYLSALESGKIHADEDNDGATKELAENLDGFFAKYGYEKGNYHANLAKLKLDIENAKKAEERKNEIKARQATVDSFKGKYQVQEDLTPYLSQLSTDKVSIAHIEEDVKKAREWATQFANEHPEIFKEEVQSAERVEDLRAKEKELDHEIAVANSDMTTLANRVSLLDGLRHERDALIQKNDQLSERHKILLAAKKHLENAQDYLKEKYVGPVKNVFNRYSKLIEKNTGLVIELDGKFNLTYQANGQFHNASIHLSDGEKMATSLCLRLAFLENMYKNENVFVILDDPFYSLDKDHLAAALKTLDGIQDKFQLLYLTCHESRMPNPKKNS